MPEDNKDMSFDDMFNDMMDQSFSKIAFGVSSKRARELDKHVVDTLFKVLASSESDIVDKYDDSLGLIYKDLITPICKNDAEKIWAGVSFGNALHKMRDNPKRTAMGAKLMREIQRRKDGKPRDGYDDGVSPFDKDDPFDD